MLLPRCVREVSRGGKFGVIAVSCGGLDDGGLDDGGLDDGGLDDGGLDDGG